MTATRLIETLAEFESLASAWDSLPGAVEDPLLSHDWFVAAARTLHVNQQLLVTTIWDGRELVAAAPLVRVRRRGVTWLEFIGSAALYEPCNLLYRDKGDLATLIRSIAAQPRPLDLQRIPADSEVPSLLRDNQSGWLVQVKSSSCNRVDLPESWESYVASRSSECRLGFPRKRKQLTAGGIIAFESLAPDPAGTAALFDEFIRVEASSWKLDNGSALAARPLMEAFFREVSRRFAARGQVRMHFLRHNGCAIAARLGLEFGGRIWGLKIGYDEKWKAASPGRILLWESLRDACARGLRAYEFLGVSDGQQQAWTTSERRLQSLVLYPYSFAGAIAAMGDAGGALVRRMKRVAAPQQNQ